MKIATIPKPLETEILQRSHTKPALPGLVVDVEHVLAHDMSLQKTLDKIRRNNGF